MAYARAIHRRTLAAAGAATILRDAPEIVNPREGDALVVDQVSQAGGTVADRLGLPWVTVCNALALNPDPQSAAGRAGPGAMVMGPLPARGNAIGNSSCTGWPGRSSTRIKRPTGATWTGTDRAGHQYRLRNSPTCATSRPSLSSRAANRCRIFTTPARGHHSGKPRGNSVSMGEARWPPAHLCLDGHPAKSPAVHLRDHRRRGRGASTRNSLSPSAAGNQDAAATARNLRRLTHCRPDRTANSPCSSVRGFRSRTPDEHGPGIAELRRAHGRHSHHQRPARCGQPSGGLGAAEVVQPTKLTRHALRRALERVLKNHRYRETAQRYSHGDPAGRRPAPRRRTSSKRSYGPSVPAGV